MTAAVTAATARSRSRSRPPSSPPGCKPSPARRPAPRRARRGIRPATPRDRDRGCPWSPVSWAACCCSGASAPRMRTCARAMRRPRRPCRLTWPPRSQPPPPPRSSRRLRPRVPRRSPPDAVSPAAASVTTPPQSQRSGPETSRLQASRPRTSGRVARPEACGRSRETDQRAGRLGDRRGLRRRPRFRARNRQPRPHRG